MSFEDSTRLPFIERPDLSPFIVHLTKRTEDGTSAFQNLIKILKRGKLKGSKPGWGKRGFIKGSTPAVCFMDVPLASLKYVLNKANTKGTNPRYDAYGVVISKVWAYESGARPVLYLSNDEVNELRVTRDQLWRVVRFDGVTEDSFGWAHEREWRAKDEFELPSKMLAVLVRTTSEAEELQKQIARASDAFKALPRSVLPLKILCQGLPY